MMTIPTWLADPQFLVGSGVLVMLVRISFQLGGVFQRVNHLEQTVDDVKATNNRMADVITVLSNALHELKGRVQ